MATPTQQPDDLVMIDPNGATVTIPKGQGQDALAQGYALASPEQHRDYILQQKYGEGGINITKAFAAGTLRGASLGLSDKLLTATGISSPEALKEREERNPIASTTGELAGIAGAAIATGGGSVGAEGAAEGLGAAARGAARFIPSNLVSGVGRAVERGVGSLLPEAGTSLASKVLATAIPKAAGSAVEGAFYAGGHEVSESALGDPHQTAESVLAHVGLGAVMSGGLGAGIGAAEVGIPAAVQAARQATSNIFQKGEDLLGKAYGSEIGQKLTGVSGDTASLMMANKEAVAALGPELGEVVSHSEPQMAQWAIDNAPKLQAMDAQFPGVAQAVLRSEPQTADFLLENFPKAITDVGKRQALATEMREGMQKVLDTAKQVGRRVNTDLAPAEEAELLKAADPKETAAAYQKLFGKVDDAVKQMRAEPELYNQSQARALEQIQEGMVRDVDSAADPLQAFRRLKTLRQSVSEYIQWDSGAAPLGISDKNANNLLKTIRGSIKDTLHDEAVFGPQAARRAALDDSQKQFLDLTTKKGSFRKLFLDTDGNVSPTKVETWLNSLAKDKGAVGAESWGKLVDATRSITDEAEASFKAAPTGEFDHESLTDLINRHADQVAEGRQAAQVTAQLKYLKSGGMGIPNSGPIGFEAAAPTTHGGMSWGQYAATHVANHLVPGSGAVIAGTAAAINFVRNVPKTVATLAWLERTGTKVANAIETGVNTLVKGGVKASYIGRGEIAAGLSTHAAKNYDDQVRAFNKRTQAATQYAQNPEQLHAALSASTQDLHEHAPDTSMALSMAQARAVSFLAAKVPQHARKGPLATPWKPTPAEMGKFNRYHDIAHNPLSVMKKAAAGTLQPEHVEALAAIYPQLHSQIQRQIMASLPKSRNVPYRSRLGISMLLGQPVDGTTSPQAIVANQRAYAPAQAQAKGPNLDGASKLTLGNRLLTPNQASNQRK